MTMDKKEQPLIRTFANEAERKEAYRKAAERIKIAQKRANRSKIVSEKTLKMRFTR